jgi:hypothetical protein
MPLPPDIAPNATCDIFPQAGWPNNPRIQGEPIFLTGAYENIKPSGTYTHMAIFSATTDIRETDSFYVQDVNGTGFNIVHLTRMGRGTPADRKVAYCNRQAVSYPTNEL